MIIVGIQVLKGFMFIKLISGIEKDKFRDFDVLNVSFVLTYIITDANEYTFAIYKTSINLPVILVFLRMIHFMNKYTNF